MSGLTVTALVAAAGWAWVGVLATVLEEEPFVLIDLGEVLVAVVCTVALVYGVAHGF